jgi:hypothetical protein
VVAREASDSEAIKGCGTPSGGRRKLRVLEVSAIAIMEHVTTRVTYMSRNYSNAFRVKGMQALRMWVTAWELAMFHFRLHFGRLMTIMTNMTRKLARS